MERKARSIGISMIFLLSLVFTGQPGLRGQAGDADFSSLLQQLSPSVVSVQALIDPEKEVWSNASGFIVDPAGVVITACHAVLGAEEVVIKLQSGELLPATVERCREDDLEAKLYDVAVLRVEKGDALLRQSWLGDSSGVGLGQEIFVMSYPDPYNEFNVVRGQISGRLRRVYLTSSETQKVYRLLGLFHTTIDWFDEEAGEGVLEDVGELLNLEASHPTLEEIKAFARVDDLVFALQSPREDRLFCGLVTSVPTEAGEGGVTVTRIDCFLLFLIGGIALEEETVTLDREVEFLKTSAPVSEGSSGGPVYNLSGQVLGIVSWGRSVEIVEDDDGFVKEVRFWPGTTFVVPAQTIRKILED